MRSSWRALSSSCAGCLDCDGRESRAPGLTDDLGGAPRAHCRHLARPSCSARSGGPVLPRHRSELGARREPGIVVAQEPRQAQQLPVRGDRILRVAKTDPFSRCGDCGMRVPLNQRSHVGCATTGIRNQRASNSFDSRERPGVGDRKRQQCDTGTAATSTQVMSYSPEADSPGVPVPFDAVNPGDHS